MTTTVALAWALLQFLWQGALIALLVKALLMTVPRGAAALRYAIAISALALMPVTVVHSAWRGTIRISSSDSTPKETPSGNEAEAPSPSAAAVSSAAADSPFASVPAPPTSVAVRRDGRSLVPWIDAMSPWIVGAWAAGALVLGLRLLAGCFAIQRLVRGHGELVPEAVKSMLERLAVRLGVNRAVRVCSSGLTRVPSVAGWLRPVVLLPASALTGLAPSHLEAILAHELAHVRRHDFLVNLVQSLIETLLFYHPAVWWLGARIREEREHCCDDLAVAACGGARLYATALLSMEQLRGAPALAPTLTEGSLLARVERLLRPRNQAVLPRWMAGMSAVAIVALLVATADFARAVPRERLQDLAGAEQAREAQAPGGEPPPGLEIVRLDVDRQLGFARRIDRAREEASARGSGKYWVGHSIAGHPALPDGLLLARFDRPGVVVVQDSHGNSLSLTGRITATEKLASLRLPGVPLAPYVGTDRTDTSVLFLCSTHSSSLAVQRVHVATASLPMDLDGLPLLWLGRADDRESIENALARLHEASMKTIQQDLIGVIGAHRTSSIVVPELTRILSSATLGDELRAEAAQRLGLHPVVDALEVLDRVARGDRSSRVRCEATEAIGAQRFAPAFDVLLALTRELRDRVVRLQAVEAIGNRTEPGAVQALLAIAQNDPDPHFQREAVETLGELPDRAGLAALAVLARSHPRADVRKEARETLRDAASPEEVAELTSAASAPGGGAR